VTKSQRRAKVLSQIIERGARVQGLGREAYVDRLRQHNPNGHACRRGQETGEALSAVVMASGAAVALRSGLSWNRDPCGVVGVAGETVVFLERRRLLLAVHEVYGIPGQHRERRRAWCWRLLVGEDSKHAVTDLISAGPHQRRLAVRRRGDVAADLPCPN